MIRRWSTASIRARLTGWYALVLLAMLIVYATATYVAVRHEFLEQLDEQLHDEFETAEGRLTRTSDGRIAWRDEEHHDPDHEPERIFEVWSATGEQLHRSGGSAPLPPAALSAANSSYRYETLSANGERWRSLTAPVSVGGHSVVLRVSRSQERVLEQLWEALVVLVLGLPLVVVLAGVGGYVLARRALQPIDQLATEAHRITAEQLHQQLSVPNQQDEIGRLAGVINGTLARLESSFDQLKRFTADASHELRTPLAVVRGIGEAAVAERRTQPEYEEAIGSILEEVDRMSNLVVSAAFGRSRIAGRGASRMTTPECLTNVTIIRAVMAAGAVLEILVPMSTEGKYAKGTVRTVHRGGRRNGERCDTHRRLYARRRRSVAEGLRVRTHGRRGQAGEMDRSG